MGDTTQGNDRLSALEAHIEEMREVIEEQQRQIEEMRGESAAHAEGDQVAPRMTSRRHLIKWAGAAAAATAATAAVSVATQQPAHAADGSNFVLGSTANTASSDTGMSVVSGAAPTTLLTVDASGSTNSSTVTGVAGISPANGTGTEGFAPGGAGAGLVGISDVGWGVIGAGGVDVAALGSGYMFFYPQVASGAPTAGGYLQGEVMVDVNGRMWICVATGTPGTWYPLSSQVFLHTPYRIFDTRSALSSTVPIDPGTPMANGQIITLQITGTVAPNDATLVVPAGASAIIGNVIAINPTGAGFLTLQPHSNTPTNSSYLHYYAGQTIHNALVMGLDSSGKLDIGNYGPATDVALDIAGFVY